MDKTRNQEAIEACRQLSPKYAHAARCALIERIAEARRKDACQELVFLLREIESPLSVKTCRLLADYFDPDMPRERSGPKFDRLEEVQKRWRAAECYGELWASMKKIYAREEASARLGISPRTLDEWTSKPFDRVVKWAKKGLEMGDISEEDCKAVNEEFWQKKNKD